jgi:class 3 adenylate cyclase
MKYARGPVVRPSRKFDVMSVTCSRCGSAAPDGARFCAACGAPIEIPGARERKLATIVFADIVGSTELVEGRDPEDVRRTLDPFLALAKEAFEEHGGRVEKFIGDAAMAVFGVPQVHGDDPDRAVAAALMLIERLPRLDGPLALRIGIETGEVLVETGRADLAVTGEATHAAARLQQAAQPGQILVGERAAAGCRRAILGEPVEVTAKGFAEPLTVRVARGIEAPGRVGGTPFLGRGGELERLRLGYLRVQRERTPTLALIVGEAGLGKTRLARELLGTIRSLSPEPEVLVGRNPPYGDGIAFWALGEIIRDAARVGSDANTGDIRAGLESRLTRVEPERRREFADTLAAAATGEGDPAGTTSGAIRLAWRRLLTSIASENPLVVAVDDVHWADEVFLELIEDSAATLNDYPILFVCTARPEILANRPAFSEDGIRVELGPLGPDAAVELAATLLAGGESGLARQVAETSGGNPFFAEEIAHSVAAGNGATERLPDTVQTAIASRLDGLSPSEKTVLQHAAILGDRFRVGPLAELLGSEPDAELSLLASRSLLHDRTSEEPGLFAFHHQLIRDVAYDSLPRADRTTLHERAAAGISPESVANHPELAEVIAFHLMQAAALSPGEERAEAAFRAARRAGELAKRRGAARRAQELFEQAAAMAPAAADQLTALSDAADIAMLRARGNDAFYLLRSAGQTAERAGEPRRAAHWYALAVEVSTRSGGISGYIDKAELPPLLERVNELVPEPDPALQAQLKIDEAWMAWRYDRDDEMGEPAREGLALAREHGDVRLLSSALDAVCATAQVEGRYADAVALSRERMDLLDGVPNQGFAGYERFDAEMMLSEALMHLGDLRGAVAEELAFGPDLLRHAPHRAYAKALQPLFHLGEWDQAIEYGVSVRSNWLEEGRPPFAPIAGEVAVIGFLYGVRDDDASARDWFSFAEEMALDSRPLNGVRVFEADLALYRGDPQRALELVESRPPDFWWGEQLILRRAETLAALGSAEAESALAHGKTRDADDPLERATLMRARAVLERDRELLLRAAELLDRHEFVFEAARTRWLAGGEARVEAQVVFERLGALPPAYPGFEFA